MWDDEQTESSAARNQLIVLMLLSSLLFLYMYFFMPQQQPPVQPQPVPVVENTTRDPGGALPEAATVAEAGSEWPFLPPVATQEDPAADEVILEDSNSQFVFTRVGARLKRSYTKLHDYSEESLQIIPEPPEGMSDADAVFPLGLRFTDERLGDEVNRRRFNVEKSPDNRSLTFTLPLGASGSIRKTFSLGETPYVLDTEVALDNASDDTVILGEDFTPAYYLTWGPRIDSGDTHTRIPQQLVWREADENDSVYLTKLAKNSPYTISDPAWIGVKSAYYLVAMKPEYEHAHLWAAGDNTAYLFGLAVPRFEVTPGQATSQRFTLYVGPSKTEYLALAWETLPSVRRFFTMFQVMDWFAKTLLAMLNWFYGIIPNYGVAIILLTIVVRGSMLPLTLKSAKSMKSMQKLAPEMEALRAKYADEPQELQQKMMEMYRERGVNPVGGCLPMVLQMPIFFALYRMLMGAYELRGAPFPIFSMGDYVWIRDLSQPDHLLELSFLHGVPYVGDYLEYLNILPFLMGGAMFLNTKILPPAGPVVNPQQKMIMNLMPLIFCVFCYNLASGLNLYIFVSTLVGIAQQAIVRSIDVESPPPKKKVARKKQHFYKAAQERKRRMVKEAKADKKGR